MLSRRSRALLDLLAGLFALGVTVAARRGRKRDPPAVAEVDDDTGAASQRRNVDAIRRGLAKGAPAGPVSRPWFLAGLATTIGYRYLDDRDVRSLRRSRSRRAVAGIASTLCVQALERYGDGAVYGFGIGSSLGTVLYRTRYGLLGAPPE